MYTIIDFRIIQKLQSNVRPVHTLTFRNDFFSRQRKGRGMKRANTSLSAIRMAGGGWKHNVNTRFYTSVHTVGIFRNAGSTGRDSWQREDILGNFMRNHVSGAIFISNSELKNQQISDIGYTCIHCSGRVVLSRVKWFRGEDFFFLVAFKRFGRI